MLDTSEVSVNSALQRARATLGSIGALRRERAPLPRSRHERELVAGFADAFEAGDLDRVLALLTDDAWVTMPPEPFEYQGHDAIAAFLSHAFAARWQHRHRLVPTRANGQPAFGHYIRDPPTGVVRGVGMLVLTVEGERISHIIGFGGAALLGAFGLPRTLPA
jgi:hypothetical protein